MIYKLIVFMALLMLLSCSGDIAGGSDNPDFIAGIVVDTLGNPLSDVSIHCIPKEYRPTLKGAVTFPEMKTDEKGSFRFKTEPGKTYSLEAYLSSTEQAIVSNLPSTSDTTLTLTAPGSLTVQIPAKFAGSVVIVSLPGTSIIDTVPVATLNDSMSTISIAALPAGSYSETVLLNDSTFVLKTPLLIKPKQETTLLIQDKSDTIKPIWEFPIVVGVHEETMLHYGGMLPISSKILAQLAEAERAFDDERIEGKIVFRVDSIYSYSTTFADENRELPDTIALRILYDAKTQSDDPGNWDKRTRTIFHDHREHNGDSLFSGASQKQLMFELGLWRGCYYRSAMEVLKEKNPISHTAFEPSPTIMQQRSSTLWSDFSTAMINYYGARYSIEPDTAKNSCADTIHFTVTGSDGKPLPGAAITLYGVTPHSLTVNTATTFHLITNQSGEALLSTGLYKGDNLTTLVYSNALVAVTIDNKSSYSWLPFDEAGLYYQKTKETRYKKNLLFR